MNKFKTKKWTVSIAVLLLIFSVSIGCKPKEIDFKQATEIIRAHAEKANPKLKGKKINVSLTLSAPSVNEVSSCVCLQVCDGNGQNCTPVECDPPGC